MSEPAVGEQRTPQDLQGLVREELLKLKGETSSDFVALALYDQEHQEIRWRIAFGARSERYKAIAIRVGKGVAGGVLSTGRPAAVEDFPKDVTEPLEYPILVVEQLISCYAAPVYCGNEQGERSVFGTIMAADRRNRSYSEEHKLAISTAAQRIGELYAHAYTKGFCGDVPRPNERVSPFMAYLQQRLDLSEGLGSIEILDQRVTRMPELLQKELIHWIDRLIGQLGDNSRGKTLQLAIERKDGCWMALEFVSPGRLECPQERLSWLIDGAGKLKGNVEMYNEPGVFRVRINLPIGLLTEGAPWIF